MWLDIIMEIMILWPNVLKIYKYWRGWMNLQGITIQSINLNKVFIHLHKMYDKDNSSYSQLQFYCTNCTFRTTCCQFWVNGSCWCLWCIHPVALLVQITLARCLIFHFRIIFDIMPWNGVFAMALMWMMSNSKSVHYETSGC